MINILVSLLLVININSSKDNINDSIITNSISSSDNYNLIVQILKDTHKEDFIKYIDYMQLNILKTIENDPNNYTAFTITLPQNKSFIAFYKKNSDNTYTFDSIVDELDNINKFYFYKNFLVIDQNSQDDKNYLNDKNFIEIFYKENNAYVSKLRKDIYVEMINLEDNDKRILSGSIDFLDDSPPKILYVSTVSGKGDNSDKEISKEIYTWDNNLYQFLINNK
jgi:hypothetical protein